MLINPIYCIPFKENFDYLGLLNLKFNYPNDQSAKKALSSSSF